METGPSDSMTDEEFDVGLEDDGKDTSSPSKELDLQQKVDKWVSDNIPERYRPSVLLLLLGFSFVLPSTLIAHYVPFLWPIMVGVDFFFTAFLSLAGYQYRFTSLISVGTRSFLSPVSLAYRLGRALLYLLLLKAFLTSEEVFDFFFLFTSVSIAMLVLFSVLTVYFEENPNHPLRLTIAANTDLIKLGLLILAIGMLGIMMRLYDIYGISTWDEGWFSDISMRMFQTENWGYPLYLEDSRGQIKLFDKPPLMFWLGAIGIQLFGYSSLAVKWPMGLFSGLMGLFGFLLYDHQRRSNKTFLIPPNTSPKDQAVEQEYSNSMGPAEEELETSDGRVTGVIFGLTMACTWFVAFYGRTSYLDPTIVAFSALTAVFGVKAIDHWFYGNQRRSYLYISLTALVNAIDLMAKAWQGLIIGPPLAIYLFARFYQHFVPKGALLAFWREAKNRFVSPVQNPYSDLLAFLGTVVTIIVYSLRTPEPVFWVSIGSFNLEIWGLLVGFFVFVALRSLIDVYMHQNNSESGDGEVVVEEVQSQVMNDQVIRLILFSLLAIVTGFLAAVLGQFGFNLINSRFTTAMGQIFEKYFTVVEDSNLRLSLAHNFVGAIGGLVGGVMAWAGAWIFILTALAILDLVYYLLSRGQFMFKIDYARKILSEWGLILPLLPFGAALGIWVYFLLFQGMLVNRSLVELFTIGIILPVAAYLASSIMVEGYRYVWKNFLRRDPDDHFAIRWQYQMKTFLLFLTFTSVVLVLSFAPFMSWLEWMDSTIVGKDGLVIRLPGELSRDPNRPEESELTYTWLFFEYYIGWRYTGEGNYSVVDSLGGFIGPLFLACVPFFLTGLYAYHKSRDYSNALFYGSWFLLVLFVFIPATFQLNYYYLAAFFPYFGLAAYGMFWTFRKTQSAIHLRDFNEKLLLSTPVCLLLALSQVVPYFLTSPETLLNNPSRLSYVVLTAIFIIGGYLFIVVFFARSIPGIFSGMFVIFYLHRYVLANGLGNMDAEFLIMSGILIGLAQYMIKDRIPLQSQFFLFLIVLSSVCATAWWLDYKDTAENGYERMGGFILDHGGEYNGSTWVFNEVGGRYAIRFYMGGIQPINTRIYSDLPFSLNSSSAMETYASAHPDLMFWVVTNRSIWDDKNPQSSWQESYKWLNDNFVWVNPLLDIPATHHVHLFVNSTILSLDEKIALAPYPENRIPLISS